MNARLTGLIGLTALGLALADPAHAAPDFPGGPIILVKKDRDDSRDFRRDGRDDDRRHLKSDGRADDYGIGYERRKLKSDDRDDGGDDRRRFRR